MHIGWYIHCDLGEILYEGEEEEKVKKEGTLSNKLSEVISVFNNCLKDYQNAYTEVNNCDKATQDILHAIELGDYKDRDKLATRLAHVRRERRKWKDIADNAEPLYSILTSPDKIDIKYFLKKLNEVLGETRKREHSKDNRIYLPKVLTDIDGVYTTRRDEK